MRIHDDDDDQPTIALWEYAYRQLERRFLREFGRSPGELERAFMRITFIDGYVVGQTGNWQLRNQMRPAPEEAARRRMFESKPRDGA